MLDYDGSIRSLEEMSRRPHAYPNMRTEAELKLIGNYLRRNPSEGLVVLWVKLKRRGYTRSLSSLYRVMQREGYFAEKSKKKPKYIPKPYTQMTYPGERIQIDVKYVPQACTQAMGKGTRLYQFTAIDEYSRKRYLEGFSDNSSYSASIFARNAARYSGFKIECIQTDNGQEFTKTFSSRYTKGEELQPTLFQTVLRQMGIRHKQIIRRQIARRSDRRLRDLYTLSKPLISPCII